MQFTLFLELHFVTSLNSTINNRTVVINNLSVNLKYCYTIISESNILVNKYYINCNLEIEKSLLFW